jgi:hypothetical protein
MTDSSGGCSRLFTVGDRAPIFLSCHWLDAPPVDLPA